MTVNLQSTKCPVCGAPLSKALYFGHTILECPYCGFSTYLTVTSGGKHFETAVPIVEPNWTRSAKQNLSIIQQEILQAKTYLDKGNDAEAYRRMVWIRNTLGRVPEGARFLPIFDKVGKSIGEAENFYIGGFRYGDENSKKQFRNEVDDLYNLVVKSAPNIGGKKSRR